MQVCVDCHERDVVTLLARIDVDQDQVGAGPALLAILPAVAEGGGRLPGGLLVGLLRGVLVVGLLTSLAAICAALRSPLLPALRCE